MLKKVLFSLLLLLFLVSCTPDKDTPYASVFYYKDTGCDSLVSVRAELPDEITKKQADIALQLLIYPEDDGFISVIPPEIRDVSLSLADEVCTVLLPDKYAELSTVSRLAINSALVKTLCSIDGISSVAISCNGDEALYTGDDFVTASPNIYSSKQTVNLYFANSTFSDFYQTTESIPLYSDKSLPENVISFLFENPVSKSAQSPIPSGTILNETYIRDGICYVDFSEEFTENAIHTEVGEKITIYSIVNTLTELPGIHSVKLLTDGRDPYGFLFFDLSKPLNHHNIS